MLSNKAQSRNSSKLLTNEMLLQNNLGICRKQKHQGEL